MQFSALPGLTDSAVFLQQQIAHDRLPHAQLLLGPPGCGKLALALAAAKYLLCTDRQESDACGTCPSCRKVGKWAHPDLHFSFPTVGSKMTSDPFLPQWREALDEHPYFSVNDWLQRIGAENKQGNITKDECLSIIRKLSLKTFEGSHKVLLLWRPEFLGAEGNRLLKLIEEPPDNTVFLLVAEDQSLILNTILSRCQLVKVTALDDAAVAESLVARGVPTDRAAAISRLVDGNLTEAIQLSAGETDDHARQFVDWFRQCYRGTAVELVAQTNTLAALGRENQKHFLRYALHFLREMQMSKIADTYTVRLQPAEAETAAKLRTLVDFAQIEAIVGLLNESVYHIERNANPKILFLDTSIQVHQILRNTGAKKQARRA